MKAWSLEMANANPVLIDKQLDIVTDSVVVDIIASALNHRDIWITKGMYPGIVLGTTMGSDACVDFEGNKYIINPGIEWGSHQAYQSQSFRVLGVPDNGTFADKIAIDKKYLHLKPTHLTDTEAAALPLAGVTAFRSLMVKCKPKKGEKVLISGIGGGVALMAMQLAIAAGCEVYVTSGAPEKISKAILLGAKAGYSYHNPDWTKELLHDSGGVDVVIDSAAGSGFNQLVKVCKPGARISFYGGSLGKIDGLNPQPIFWKQISILGSTMGSDQDFVDMLAFVCQHNVVPILDSVIAFDNMLQGFSKMNAGKQFGKIVFQH